MRLGVRFDLNELKREIDQKGRKRVDAAAGIALRRIATTVRKTASVSIRERLAISAAVAREAISIRRSGSKLTVFIQAEGRPIPLRDYGARQTRKGVSYRVSKSRGRRIYESKYGPGFIVESIAGNVFVRAGRDPPGPRKAPIRKVYGPSVPQYFVTRIVRELMLATARQRWPIEFAAAWRGLSLRSR